MDYFVRFPGVQGSAFPRVGRMDCCVEDGDRAVPSDKNCVWITLNCHRRKRTFVEEGKMSRRVIRADVGSGHDGAEDAFHGFLMSPRYRHDAFGIAMLGDGKRKCAPSKFRAIGLFVQALENQSDLISRRFRFLQNLLEGTDDAIVAVIEIGGYEMILGGKMSVQGCLGNFCLLDDSIYANRADAVPIKQCARCGDNLL